MNPERRSPNTMSNTAMVPWPIARYVIPFTNPFASSDKSVRAVEEDAPTIGIDMGTIIGMQAIAIGIPGFVPVKTAALAPRAMLPSTLARTSEFDSSKDESEQKRNDV
jgi:hypothetical protein